MGRIEKGLSHSQELKSLVMVPSGNGHRSVLPDARIPHINNFKRSKRRSVNSYEWYFRFKVQKKSQNTTTFIRLHLEMPQTSTRALSSMCHVCAWARCLRVWPVA